MLEMTFYDWLNQQTYAYSNSGLIQDFYIKKKFICSSLMLLNRRSWKIILFASDQLRIQPWKFTLEEYFF